MHRSGYRQPENDDGVLPDSACDLDIRVGWSRLSKIKHPQRSVALAIITCRSCIQEICRIPGPGLQDQELSQIPLSSDSDALITSKLEVTL